jgi:hypothetical protein
VSERQEARDERSVGELLLDADLTSRAILVDPQPDTARAKTRTWGELVEAAAELWAAIPDPGHDQAMDRIHQHTGRLVHRHRRSGWPGPGAGDLQLEHITSDLSRAAELVSWNLRDWRQQPSGAAHSLLMDAEAARTRLMHILYVSGHAVAVTLRGHIGTLRSDVDAGRRTGNGDSLVEARVSLQRLGTVERLAGSYLRSRWPTALSGEHRDPTEPSRLGQALARWDMQAHRSLAASPSAAGLLFTAAIQRDLTIATELVAAAAAHTGALDPARYRAELAPALHRLDHAWSQLLSDLQQLTGRHRRLDPELLLAGNEVRAALREITHDGSGLGAPGWIARQADLTRAGHHLQFGIADSIELAHSLRDVVNDPELAVTARGAHALTAASSAPAPLSAWVAAGDLHHNRPVWLPEPARARVAGHVAAVAAAAMAMESASTVLGTAVTRPTHHELPSRSARTNESCDLPHAVPRTKPATWVGCER